MDGRNIDSAARTWTADELRQIGTPEPVISALLHLQFEREVSWHALRDESSSALRVAAEAARLRAMEELHLREISRLRAQLSGTQPTAAE